MSDGTLLTIIMGVIVLAVAAVTLTVNAVFNALNARSDALISRMGSHERVVGEQLLSIKAAVETGTEEHKVWQDAMKETNERMADQFDKSNRRIDQLLMHLLDQKK